MERTTNNSLQGIMLGESMKSLIKVLHSSIEDLHSKMDLLMTRDFPSAPSMPNLKSIGLTRGVGSLQSKGRFLLCIQPRRDITHIVRPIIKVGGSIKMDPMFLTKKLPV